MSNSIGNLIFSYDFELKSDSFGSKRYFIDLLHNDLGYVVKLKEVRHGYEPQMILIPLQAIPHLIKGLNSIVMYFFKQANEGDLKIVERS